MRSITLAAAAAACLMLSACGHKKSEKAEAVNSSSNAAASANEAAAAASNAKAATQNAVVTGNEQMAKAAGDQAAAAGAQAEKAGDAAKKAGKDIMRDPRMMDRIGKMMELTLKDVITLSGTQSNSLMKLIAINPRDIIAEGARLASIAKDPSSSAHEKATARKAISLIIKAAGTVDVIAVNAAAEARQQAKIAKIIEVSEKIASLEFGQSSKTAKHYFTP